MEITTLIPAYRADYLSDLFRGLSSQTYRNFKVIISDDSPDRKISEIIRKGAFSEYTKSLHITLLDGPGDEVKNHNSLVKYWGGTTALTHIHHDDDYIFPEFYEKHVEAHQKHDILLSASGRWFAKSDGIPCEAPTIAEFANNKSGQFQKLNSQDVIRSMLMSTRNWIGEVTNMVISKNAWKYSPFIPDPQDPYYGLTDVSLIIKCASKGSIAYSSERHGVYRIHGGQGTFNYHNKSWEIPRLCWIAYSIQAWKDGHLSEINCIEALNSALEFCNRELTKSEIWAKLFEELNNSATSLNSFAEKFNEEWLKIRL